MIDDIYSNIVFIFTKPTLDCWDKLFHAPTRPTHTTSDGSDLDRLAE